jgi:hypothetical protein
MKTNAYYLYLLGRIDKVAAFQDGLTLEERKNKELVKQVTFALLFMTADKIANEASREDTYPEEVSIACMALTYSDIYEIVQLLVVEPEIMNYELT